MMKYLTMLIAMCALLAAGVVAVFTAGTAAPSEPQQVPHSLLAAPTSPVTPKVIGMSAPASLWAQRLSEVGRCGVEARRIFADLQSDGRDQSNLIEQTVAAGMMPVISYKVPSVSAMIAGDYDQWMTALKNYLNGLGVQVTATFWHEPHGDMTAAEFRQASQKFLNRVKATNVAVGPILNGWLLDNQVATFASYTNTSLLTGWDFVAVDSYQNGTASSPGNRMPARAIPALADWLDGKGYPNKPIGLGEYNGHTAAAITEAGETILSTPEVWFGLAWNSTAGAFSPLEGDRLTAYKNTKADPRAKKGVGC